MHDDANELAAKKCTLLWANIEYDKLHEEMMQGFRHSSSSGNDSSTEREGKVAIPMQDEKELSDKLEKLSGEIKDLNNDIDMLNEQFYKKYNDKELAALTSDVKALVIKCKP